MSKKRWIAVLVLLGIMALFVPFVPQTQASGHFAGSTYQRTADVSPSYYFFHCGGYVNSQEAIQLGSGYAGFSQLSRGYGFSCAING